MSDHLREIAVVGKVREVFPDSSIHFGSRGNQYPLGKPVVRVVDLTNQDIGGGKEEMGVMAWVEGWTGTHYFSDEDLPPPTSKPHSQAVHLARVIEGIEKAPHYSEHST